MKKLLVLLAAIMILPSISEAGRRRSQTQDPNYVPVVESPAYEEGHGPLILIDSTHNNFHKIPGRYQPFANLHIEDGYVVDSLSGFQAFTAACIPDWEACPFGVALNSARILVISNAQSDISPEEAQAIFEWVSNGGRLWLIADKTNGQVNFPGYINELSVLLGIDWHQITIGKSWFDTFEKSNDTLEDHAITNGLTSEEEVFIVETFTGSALAFIGPFGGTHIMNIPEGTLAWEETEEGPQAISLPAGLSQGLVIEIGNGKVFATGEAGAYTAQLKSNGEPFGMHVTPYNEQFVLNITHWLDDIL